MNDLRTVEKRVLGRSHGPITRVISPGDLGDLLKPFVFLDFIHANIPDGFGFEYHPHSGIATLTYQRNVDVHYVDTEGKEGILKAGGLEWMQSGGGAWHQGSMPKGGLVTAFQLWVALPPGVEDGPSRSEYVAPDKVPDIDGVRVLLGEYSGTKSSIITPSPMNYFDVAIKSGTRWRFEIDRLHSQAWAFVYEGKADVCGATSSHELLILSALGHAIEVVAHEDARMIFGSGANHPFPLITGPSSVHTNKTSLAKGEAKIMAIGERLKREGKLDS